LNLVQLYSYFYFVLFVLGLITAIEVLIRFHRPVFLKIILFTLTFVSAFRSLGFSIVGYGNFNRLIHELPSAILVTCLIAFYAYLYEQRIKKLILGIAFTIAILQVGFALYFTIILNLPVDKSTYELYGFNVPLFIMRTTMMLLMLFTISRLFLSIMRKYDKSNMYFMKLRSWSITLFWTSAALIIFNVLKEFGGNFNHIGEAGVLIGHYATCC
jgi:hypothetical protein